MIKQTAPVEIVWMEVKPGWWVTKTVDPRNGKTYISELVPTAFKERLVFA